METRPQPEDPLPARVPNSFMHPSPRCQQLELTSLPRPAQSLTSPRGCLCLPHKTSKKAMAHLLPTKNKKEKPWPTYPNARHVSSAFRFDLTPAPRVRVLEDHGLDLACATASAQRERWKFIPLCIGMPGKPTPCPNTRLHDWPQFGHP